MLKEPLMLNAKRDDEGEFGFSTETPRADLERLVAGAGMPFYLRNLKTQAFALLWFVMEWREVSPDGNVVIVHGRDDSNRREVEVKYHLNNAHLDRVTTKLRTPAIL